MSHAYGKMPYNCRSEGVAQWHRPTRTTARLEARISEDLHATLKRAAALQDRTVTDFVVAAVQEAAERAIQQADVMLLSLQDQERFAALLTPAKPNAALKRAFTRHRKLIAPT